MTGLLLKVLICPSIIILADWLSPHIQYTALHQPLVVGLARAFLAHIGELMFLRPGRLWLASLSDFIGSSILIYTSQYAFPGVSISVMGAIVTGLAIGISEYFQHRYLLSTGKTRT